MQQMQKTEEIYRTQNVGGIRVNFKAMMVTAADEKFCDIHLSFVENQA